MGYPEAVPHHRVDSTRCGLSTSRTDVPKADVLEEFKFCQRLSIIPSPARSEGTWIDMADSGTSSKGYSSEQIRQFAAELRKLRNETAGVQIVLHDLSQRLTNPRARTFANQGLGRRLPLVARSASNIFSLFPPESSDLLTRTDCDDVAIQLHAFAINVYAIFDNIAWVCMLEAGGTLSPLKVCVFKKECQPFLPQALKDYLDQEVTKKWFKEYGKVYRDSTAHRIAAYLPSRAYTPEEGQRFADLHERAHRVLFEAANSMPHDRKRIHELLDLHDALNREKETLGSNSLLIALSLTGDDASPPVYLHPQLLCDWALANDVVRTFDGAMREHYGWPALPVPSLQVN